MNITQHIRDITKGVFTFNGVKTFADGLKTQGQDISPFSGFKNYLINGNFDVWQYATSQTSHGYGSDDRWGNFNVGSTKTHSQVASTDTERALFNSSKFSRTVVTSVAGAGNLVYKVQRIEDVTKLAGKTVTISFWAKADSNKNIAIEFYQAFGTGGTPSTAVNGIGSQLVALTSTLQKKSITVTIPSIVGKVLGTDGVHTSYTQLAFWFDAGSDFNTRTANLGQQSGTFDIAEVQIEEGAVATPFEYRPYGLELSLCQRYYEKKIASSAITLLGSGGCSTTTQAIVLVPFVKKRAIPTISFSAANTFSISTAGTAVVVGSIGGTTSAGLESFQFTANGITCTAGNGAILIGTSTTSTSIDISAEL